MYHAVTLTKPPRGHDGTTDLLRVLLLVRLVVREQLREVAIETRRFERFEVLAAGPSFRAAEHAGIGFTIAVPERGFDWIGLRRGRRCTTSSNRHRHDCESDISTFRKGRLHKNLQNKLMRR